MDKIIAERGHEVLLERGDIVTITDITEFDDIMIGETVDGKTVAFPAWEIEVNYTVAEW